MLIAVCLAFVDPRPQVDALSGEVSTDERAGRLTDACEHGVFNFGHGDAGDDQNMHGFACEWLSINQYEC